MTTTRMPKALPLILAAVIAALSSGCGGAGGGAGTPPGVPDRPSQDGTLTLTQSGDRQVAVGTGFDNPAISSLARTVTYTSSDPGVARVSASGRVDTFLPGTATITATESAAGGRMATYRVQVAPAVLQGSLIDGRSLRSTHTGITYPYSVYLPFDYERSGKSYPVLYMTDGQWASNLYQIADRKRKEIILVIIHQGPENRRMIDYLPQGASLYARFLKEEIAPLIESTYRTTLQRTYYGVSAGGTLGAILLAGEPVGRPYFHQYILADSAFFALTPQTVQAENARYAASPVLDINIFLTGTRQANLPGVQDFARRYLGRNYQGMTLQVSEYNNLTHDEMSDPTFTEAMDRFF